MYNPASGPFSYLQRHEGLRNPEQITMARCVRPKTGMFRRVVSNARGPGCGADVKRSNTVDARNLGTFGLLARSGGVVDQRVPRCARAAVWTHLRRPGSGLSGH